MFMENDPPRDADASGKTHRQPPRSALETELNDALDRLDHQVQDTKHYLAGFDKRAPAVTPGQRRRATDRKPSGEGER